MTQSSSESAIDDGGDLGEATVGAIAGVASSTGGLLGRDLCSRGLPSLPAEASDTSERKDEKKVCGSG